MSAHGDDGEIVPIDRLVREATERRLAELVGRVDRPPAGLVEAVGRAPRWRSIDDELARLAYDSAADPELLAAVRAVDAPGRHLTFEAPELTLEVEVTTGRPRQLTCQVVPAQPALLEVRHRDGLLSSRSDPHGTFHLASVPPGPVSLRCVPSSPGALPVATSWIEL